MFYFHLNSIDDYICFRLTLFYFNNRHYRDQTTNLGNHDHITDLRFQFWIFSNSDNQGWYWREHRGDCTIEHCCNSNNLFLKDGQIVDSYVGLNSTHIEDSIVRCKNWKHFIRLCQWWSKIKRNKHKNNWMKILLFITAEDHQRVPQIRWKWL